ncbi:MAG: fused MFS/spermidine synthase [Candidatus Sericytochromatia bacterium]
MLFALSGVAALIYESVWARYLKLLLGHAAYGQIVTLTLFMGGMAIGSFLGGKYVRALKSPLYLYALVEVFIGLGGLCYHPLFKAANAGVYQFGPALKALPGGLALLKLLAALLITTPWAILLGMTFPCLAVGLMSVLGDGGQRSLPSLYFTNSLGGALGILLASFVLIPHLGTPGALTVASTLNLMLGLTFFLMMRHSETPITQTKTRKDTPEADKLPLSDLQFKLLLGVSLGTGLSSFIYEICWVRLLSLVLGSSTHSFDLMISAFIFGLACGSFCSGWILKKTWNPLFVLGGIQIAMGLCAGLSICSYNLLFDWMSAAHGVLNHTEAAYYWFAGFKYSQAILLMFPASFFAGMTLPLLTRIMIQAGKPERTIGDVYAFNTLGAIAGTILAGMVLMPWLQLKWNLVSGALLDIFLGLAILASAGVSLTGQLSTLATSLALLIPVFLLELNAFTLSKGVFRNTPQNSRQAKTTQTKIRHGRTATISFQDFGSRRTLRTNGKPDASIDEVFHWGLFSDEITQISVAAYPMTLMKPNYRAAMIGFGSGMTSHILLGDPWLKQLDQIEIEQEVVNLARGFLPFNRRAYESPKQNLIIDDARNFFSTQTEKYELIISEPSNPWVSGVSNLFTQEFYQDLKRYLKPEGLLVQWIHSYEFDSRLLLSILSALKTQFPYLTLLGMPTEEVGKVATGDLVILASTQPHHLPFAHQQRPLPVLAEDLKRLKLTPAAFDRTNQILTVSSLAHLIDRYHPNSDFFPVVENQAELHMFTGNIIDLEQFFLNTPAYYQLIFEADFQQILQARQLKALPELKKILEKLDFLLSAPPEIRNQAEIHSHFTALTSRFLPILNFQWPILQKYLAYLKTNPDLKTNVDEFQLLEAHRNQNAAQSRLALKKLSQLSPDKIQPGTVRLMMVESLRHKDLNLFKTLLDKIAAPHPQILPLEKAYLRALLPSS